MPEYGLKMNNHHDACFASLAIRAHGQQMVAEYQSEINRLARLGEDFSEVMKWRDDCYQSMNRMLADLEEMQRRMESDFEADNPHR